MLEKDLKEIVVVDSKTNEIIAIIGKEETYQKDEVDIRLNYSKKEVDVKWKDGKAYLN